VDDPNPFGKGLHGARFSAQFNMALILKEGEEAYRKVFDPKWVKECLNCQEIKQIMKKIQIFQDDELDQYFPNQCVTVVDLEAKDGRQFAKRIDFPYGEPENPIGIEGIIKKFRLLSSGKIGQSKQERIIDAVLNLERLSEVRGLLQDLTCD
jgi:2-methylcitrate dehydratase PrpD